MVWASVWLLNNHFIWIYEYVVHFVNERKGRHCSLEWFNKWNIESAETIRHEYREKRRWSVSVEVKIFLVRFDWAELRKEFDRQIDEHRRSIRSIENIWNGLILLPTLSIWQSVQRNPPIECSLFVTLSWRWREEINCPSQCPAKLVREIISHSNEQIADIRKREREWHGNYLKNRTFAIPKWNETSLFSVITNQLHRWLRSTIGWLAKVKTSSRCCQGKRDPLVRQGQMIRKRQFTERGFLFTWRTSNGTSRSGTEMMNNAKINMIKNEQGFIAIVRKDQSFSLPFLNTWIRSLFVSIGDTKMQLVVFCHRFSWEN